jgi:predicted protein tyrosine phosphatase
LLLHYLIKHFLNILFICSRNQWRSPTAEAIFKNHPHIRARSAGTEPSARIRVNEKLLLWADMIFVMEKRHREKLHRSFAGAMSGKDIVVLEIPDEYKFMDDELIEVLQESLQAYIDF